MLSFCISLLSFFFVFICFLQKPKKWCFLFEVHSAGRRCQPVRMLLEHEKNVVFDDSATKQLFLLMSLKQIDDTSITATTTTPTTVQKKRYQKKRNFFFAHKIFKIKNKFLFFHNRQLISAQMLWVVTHSKQCFALL